jgi:hypothetical protein
MMSKIVLSAVALMSLAASVQSAQAGYIYLPDDDYAYHAHHHVVRTEAVEEVAVSPKHLYDSPYYQKKVLVDSHYTYKTCRQETAWDAESNPIPVENCK